MLLLNEKDRPVEISRGTGPQCAHACAQDHFAATRHGMRTDGHPWWSHGRLSLCGPLV